MGVGFIQLITTGHDNTIFNKEPQISFFKIYYRRHTNFFINNYEINGNFIRNNNKISFIIPKNGDLLGKTYLNIQYKENYTELFEQFNTLNCTLNTNILNFYDSYSVRTIFFNIDDIKEIEIAKFNFMFGGFTYLTIFCDNFNNKFEFLDLIKSVEGIYLQTDINNIFYNINEYYKFYGFNYTTSSTNFLKNDFALYLFNQINYNILQSIQIDITNYNLSVNISFSEDQKQRYSQISNYIFNNSVNKDILSVKIIKYSLYISITYNNIDNIFKTELSDLFDLIFSDTKEVDLEIIDNKIKSTKYVIDGSSFDFIKKIFMNVKKDYVVYYKIIYDKERTSLTVFDLKDVPYFGNFLPNDFNEGIIQNETSLIKISNLSTFKIATNLYIRLYVSLICNKIISIQDFLKITNNDYNLDSIITKYSKSLSEFNKKILDILMNNKILILSDNIFRRIIYQNNIKNQYVITNKITSFADRKITVYQNVLLNFYLYYDIINKFSSKYNETYNVTDGLIAQLIYISKLSLISNESGDLFKTYSRNYLYNNNFFNLVENPENIVTENNVIIFKNSILDNNINITKIVLENLVANYLIIFITESINIISNIFNKSGHEIYTSYGQLSNIFVNYNISTSVFPLPSSIYISLGNVKDQCQTTNQLVIPNDITIFNTSQTNYYNNILINVRKNIESDFNEYKTNFNTKIEISEDSVFNNSITDNELYIKTQEYFNGSINEQNQFNTNLIKSYIVEAYNSDFISIYSVDFTINIYDFFMYNFFNYADNTLFNKSFQNFTFNIKKSCTEPPVKTSFIDKNQPIPMYNSFIFNVNIPYYRILNLFIFLAYLTKDSSITASIPSDLSILRDIILKFLYEFVTYENNLTNQFIKAIEFQTQYIDTSIVKENKYNLINNFLVYDPINIFNNEYFNYLLSLNKDNTFFFLYNCFYFIKNIFSIDVSDSSLDVSGTENIIEETIFQYLYNFDDKIIILLLKVLELNKNLFIFYNDIIDLVNLFFNKVNFDYLSIVKQITTIYYKSQSSESVIADLNTLLKNSFYYNCYYTIYSYGAIFDNSNASNINTINGIFNISSIYNQYFQGSSIFVKKNLDVKKNINFINNSNIVGSFNYISTLFNNINFSNNFITFEYYLQLLNSINNYIIQNVSYLVNYTVSELIFRQCLNKLLLYVELFNKINNSKIEIIQTYYFTPITSFTTFNIITINLLYVSFLNQCMFADVFTFFQSKYSTTGNDFNKYLIDKYSVNIYTQCLIDFIEIIGTTNALVSLDYANILINKLIIGNEFNIVNYSIKNYFDKIFTKNKINENDTIQKIFYNQLNPNSNIIVYSSGTYIFSLNTSFYFDYNNLVNNFISQYNKILYSLYNGGLVNKTISSNFLSDVSLQQEYDNIRKVIYNSTTFIILNNIYANIIKASSSGLLQKYFSNEIQINILVNNIQFFSVITPTTSYFDTLYNIKCKTITNTNNLTNVLKQNTNSDLYLIDNLIYFYSNYVNRNIINSIYFEKDINRIIYLLCTSHAIDLSKNRNKSIEFLKKNPLYNVVRVFNYNNTGLKIYLENTSLYQDIDIFEVLNYSNWTDEQSFMKNTWVNKIIDKMDMDADNVNSFYRYFIQFKNFVIKNLPLVKDFKLSSGVAVIDYFSDIKNIDELHNYIFNLYTLTENFSPQYLYQNIIDIRNDINISSYLIIDIDNIKKKIIIFSYFNFLIFSFIHILLIENFRYNERLFLEYNIDGEIITFSLNDVLAKETNRLIINYYISESYKIDDDTIENNLIFDLPINYENKYEINFLLGLTRDTIHLSYNLLMLIDKYISSYEIQIGNSDMTITSTITTNVFNSTLSNLVQRLNVVFNLDIVVENLLNTKLTRSAINFLDIYFKNNIYDYNNIVENINYPSSIFVENNKTYYRDTNISDLNLTLNLDCNLLKNFEITYDNLTEDMNVVIGNIRLGTKYINDILESFKGVTSNFNISIDLILYENKLEKIRNFANDTLYTQFLSRSNNIRFLGFISTELDNLSVCVPNDYDFGNGNLDFGKFFPYFFEKYYSIVYNYYNFDINYTVVYPRLNEYLANIIDNSIALKHIKNELELYKNVYYTIIYTLYTVPFYSSNSVDETSYINMLNNQIQLYKKFNFEFKLNKNKNKNVSNLELQNYFNKDIVFTKYDDMYIYLVELYNYILLMTPINTNPNNAEFDLVTFFNTIRLYENYNMIYRNNFINYVFRLEISLILMIKKVEIQLGIKVTFNQSILNKIIEGIINSICDPDKINNFINEFYSNTDTTTKTQKITINIIINIIKYKNFINTMALAIRELIYYTNNSSVESQINMVWQKYFKNVAFDYLRVTFYDYVQRTYRMDIDDFTSFVFSYLQYYYNSFRVKELSLIINNLADYLTGVFKYKNQKNEIINLDLNVIQLIIFNQPISKPNSTDYEKAFDIISTIIDLLASSTWNLINFTYISNTNKPFIDLQITFFNFYLSYIDYINSFTDISINDNNYNYVDFIKTNNNLLILYRLIILIICSEYIIYDKYKNIIQYILTDCNNYVYNGKKINTLDLRKNIASYFDYLNKNIIPNNIINNYYKDIQNNSVIDIYNYKITKFKQSNNNFDFFLVPVYNKYINELGLTNENDIGKLFINNTILNLINNYNGLIYKVAMIENLQSAYVSETLNFIITNINANLSEYKLILGGDSIDINNIYLSTKNILQLFNGSSYQIGDKLVTIFSIIYSQIKSALTNNDILILLFYYNCFVTWISTHCNNYINSIDKIIYDFSNLINKNILRYTELITKEPNYKASEDLYTENNPNSNIIDLTKELEEKKNNIIELINLDKFFDGLNLILFNTFSNKEYIDICYNFFNNIVDQNTYFNKKIIKQSVNFNIKTYNGNNFNKDIGDLINTSYNNEIYNDYIKNNKLIAWKYFLGLIVDFNSSIIIKLMKSTYGFGPINPTNDFIAYIEKINNGLIFNYGVLKIFNQINLQFDDEQIDSVTPDNYKILLNLFTNLDKYPALVDMLGININGGNEEYITNGLTNWIKKFNNKTFNIPMLFFFQKYNNAIPLIAGMYTNFSINVGINSYNIFKNAYITSNLTEIAVFSSLNMDYILLEREERKRICEKQIDNLIETHNSYNQNILINEVINETYGDIVIIRFDFGINQMVKELIWDYTFYLDKFKITNRYKEDINTSYYNIYDAILNTRFYIDGARRDGIINLSDKNFNGITTNINPYRYHTRANGDNIYNVYSFGLEPEEFQPTGAMNLNPYRVFTIEIVMTKKGLVDYINNTNNLFGLNKLSIEINLHTINYNFVRYQSGLSGLLFAN